MATYHDLCVIRVGNCAFLVANATKNFALATRISQLVATFSYLATEKKGQSPVGACLKKLISDPSSSNHMVDDHDVWGKCRDQIALRKSDHTCQAFN